MKKTLNRWVYLIIGAIAMFFVGLIYAWSVISGFMVGNHGWTDSQLVWVSTIVLCFFCAGGFLAGIYQKKINIKILLGFSAVLFFVGFLITASATSVILVYVGFGACAGFGTGLVYNVILSVVSKWFPDKQGMVSGVLLMTFGIGSFIIGKVFTAVVSGGMAWQTCIIGLGIICAVIIGICAALFVNPSPEETAKLMQGINKKSVEYYEDIPAGQMLKRPSFWLLFIWSTLTIGSGIAIIFLGRPIAITAVPALADAPGTVATVVGLTSVCNAISRIASGSLFDKIKYKIILVACSVLFIISMFVLMFAMSTGSIVLLFIAYILTGLGYGVVPPTQSAFTNRFYGSTYYPVNFSIVIMNLVIGSFASKLADAVYGSTNSYNVVIWGIIVICAVSIIAALLIKTPKKAADTSVAFKNIEKNS